MTYLAERQGTSYQCYFRMYGSVRKHPNQAIHIICDMTYLAERQGTSYHSPMCTSRFGCFRTDSYTSGINYVCMARFGSFPNRAIHTGIGQPIWPANAVIESAIVALPIAVLAGRIGWPIPKVCMARFGGDPNRAIHTVLMMCTSRFGRSEPTRTHQLCEMTYLRQGTSYHK